MSLDDILGLERTPVLGRAQRGGADGSGDIVVVVMGDIM